MLTWRIHFSSYLSFFHRFLIFLFFGSFSAGKNLYRRLEAYGEHFLRLSRLDFGEEQEVFRLRQRESNLQKLISDGVVLIDLIATDDGLFFSDNVISFSSFRRENFPRHVRFSQGDIVDISRGLEEIRGTVLQRTRSTLRVIPEDQEVDIQGPGWRIDLGFNAITHERICSALEQVVEIGKASGRDQVRKCFVHLEHFSLFLVRRRINY